jgi:N-acyl-D-aspartate/D-glutamate deacylase
MSTHDLVIRNGLLVDGTGAEPIVGDLAVDGDRLAAVGTVEGGGRREIDAEGRIVTPGFVDIHSHLDAQVAWDPILSSSCWHGVTSIVMGNCGVTFAPCRPEDRTFLAEMMESVEDIPADSIMSGLPWDWVTYGEYLDSLERMPKGLNVGGMVGHAAVRYQAMGDRSADDVPATPEEIATMCGLVEEAVRAGALGFSTSRTLLHKVPDGRCVPGTWATVEEMLALGDVLGRLGKGVFEAAPQFERDTPDYAKTRAEVGWMAELSRSTARPVTFGIAQADARPELYQRAIEFAAEGNRSGAQIRPQTTVRGIGVLFGLACGRTPFDRGRAWKELRGLPVDAQLARLRDPDHRAALVADAELAPGMDAHRFFVLHGDDATYEPDPANSLGGIAAARGTTVPDAYIETLLATNGEAVLTYPFLNQRMDAVEEMAANPMVVLGLADAGAHVGQILDASQCTYYLRDWVRDFGRVSLPEAVRRMTSDTAWLFGLDDRGVLRPGAKADVNVIDLEHLRLPAPEYVNDFPGGAGRFVQRSSGYDYTLVNGEVFMDHGEHTGAFAGRVLRS